MDDLYNDVPPDSASRNSISHGKGLHLPLISLELVISGCLITKDSEVVTDESMKIIKATQCRAFRILMRHS